MIGSTLKLALLTDFSSSCRELYLSAELTPGFLTFLNGLKGPKYIASGSSQEELKEVFDKRGLTQYFKEIFGSPTTKAENIRKIIGTEQSQNTVMFGDALSDLDAAEENGIDFIAYTPFSNVKQRITNAASERGYSVVNDWRDE